MSSDRDTSDKPGSFVRRFCGYTTAHGLGRCSQQSSFVGKLIWLSFLLATYSGFGYHLYTLFSRYQQSPVLTTITVSTLPCQFPDVYICPAHAVTVSRIVKSLPARAIADAEYFSKKTSHEKIHFYDFDLSSESGSAYLNMPVKAFLATLENTERAVITRRRSSTDGLNCRISPGGLEYAGNASRAAVYGPKHVRLTLKDAAKYKNGTFEIPLEPYASHRQCMRWNDAARMLKSRGAANFADQLLQLNFSDSESRCRSPPGLPLSALRPIATVPMSYILGCAQMTSEITQAFFNITCYRSGMESFDTCSACCDKLNAPIAALVNQGDCLCAGSLAAPAVQNLLEHNRTSCDRQCANDPQNFCPTDGATAAFFLNREVEDKPLHIGNPSDLKAYSDGTYCFYLDSERLNAGFCDIPYCSMSDGPDCVVSTDQTTALPLYTGKVNRTGSGRPCLPWSRLPTVQMEMQLNQAIQFMGKLVRLHIQTPDGIENSDDNFCRPVSVVIDVIDNKLGTFARTAMRWDIPACFPEEALLHLHKATISQNYFFDMAFEGCSVPFCSEESSMKGIFSDSIGSHLLARQFGSDLTIGLAECSFANQKCTKEDFVNVQHPQLGVCHQFLKQKFIANMTSTQLAQSQLSITYFTDSTDSKGQTAVGMSLMNKFVHNSRVSETSQLAFKAVIVPEGTFPWPSKGVDVAATQRMDVNFRLERYSRLSTPSRPCLETTTPVVYRLPAWDNSMSNEDSRVEAAAYAVLTASDWSEMVARFKAMLQLPNSSSILTSTERAFNVSGREDCLNSYIVKQFTENCQCLPSNLPIEAGLFKRYKYCFDVGEFSAQARTVESCYKEHLSKIQQYQFDAIKHCESPCQTDSYNVRYVTYPWPNLKTVRSIALLETLASNYGYRTRISGLRGLTNFYQAFLKALLLEPMPVVNRSTDGILNFDKELEALENRLAKLTVQAWSSNSQEITEEEAYPAKNLAADTGGALGLWSGISILTVCELFELLIYIGPALVLSLRRRPTRNCSATAGEDKTDPEAVCDQQGDTATAV